NFLWQMNLPVLNRIMFPWRINSTLLTLQLLGIALFFRNLSLLRPYIRKHIQSQWLIRLSWVTLYAALLSLCMFNVSLYPFKIQHKRQHMVRSLQYDTFVTTVEKGSRPFTTAILNEIAPITAKHYSLPNRLVTKSPIAETKQGTIIFAPDHTHHRIHFTVTFAKNAEKPSVTLNQMMLPGWKVFVNGQPAYMCTPSCRSTYFGKPHMILDDHGRIQIDFRWPGAYDVIAYYEGPPGWQKRNWAIAILTTLFLGLIATIRHHRKHPHYFAPLFIKLKLFFNWFKKNILRRHA
ncbi:MAG: hypothetical protein K2Q01_10650, partial [Rickettsiales bacterium]|nr:hypothetical protein [Rickettsiales bacterium]